MTAPTPPTSALVRPFTVSISDSEIDDVKQRLANSMAGFGDRRREAATGQLDGRIRKRWATGRKGFA